VYVLDVASLKDALAMRDVSSLDSMRYLLGFSFLCLPESIPYVAARSGPFLFYSLLSSAVFILGILYCYRMNGGRDGTNFLPRFISLSWVISVRFVVVLFPLGLLIALMSAVAEVGWFREWRSHPLMFVLSVCVSALFFFRVGVHISDVSARLRTAA
jgi:hypothetical protein